MRLAKRKVRTAVSAVLSDSACAGQTTEYTEYTEGEPKERGHSCPLIDCVRLLQGQECPRSYSQALGFRTAGDSRPYPALGQADLDCSGRAKRRRSFGTFSALVFQKAVTLDPEN